MTVIVMTPLTWHSYLQARSIQGGPAVQATLQNGWVVASNASGTHDTTHFDVTFTTRAGQPVHTSFTAAGIWSPLNPGARMTIRYDPHNPDRAAIPGQESTILAATLLLTGTTVLLLLPWLIVASVRYRRPRRSGG
jgi:hypothetical protein